MVITNKTLLKQPRLKVSACWLLLVVLVINTPAVPAQELLDNIVAIVENEAITQLELNQSIANAKASLAQQNIQPADDKTLLAQVLQHLITRKLQLQEAEKLNIRIDDITLDRSISQMAQNYQMDINQFRNHIQQEGGNYERLRDQVREKLTITRLVQREVIDNMEVSEEEIKNYLMAKSDATKEQIEYHFAHWKTALRVAEEPIVNQHKRGIAQLRNTLIKEEITSFARLQKRSRDIWNEFWQALGYTRKQRDTQGDKSQKDPPQIPQYALNDLGWQKPEELPAPLHKRMHAMNTGESTGIIATKKTLHWFYLLGVRNKDHGMTKEEYNVRHILLQTNPLEDDDTIETRLAKMKRAIEKNDNFEKFAKKYSQDPGSSFKGGNLGWSDLSNFASEFSQAIILADTKDGIIGPFRSGFGWHLVEVLGKREKDVGDTMARQEAISQIKQGKLQEEQNLWLLNLKENHHIEVRL